MNIFQQFGLALFCQVTAICLAAALMIKLLRHSATSRHTIGLIALTFILASPLFVGMLPRTIWRSRIRGDSPPTTVAIPHQPPLAIPHFEPTAAEATAEIVVPPSETPILDQSEVVVSRPRFDSAIKTSLPSLSTRPIRPLLVPGTVLMSLLWIAGSMAMIARRCWQQWRLQSLIGRLSRGSTSNATIDERVANEVLAALNLQQLPPIFLADLVPMPMVLGIWRCRIVLPRSLLTSDQDRLRDVLIHECAHISRRDSWVNAAQQVAAVAWWWHPGVWWLNRQIAQSREEICDNFVLRHSDPPSYAQTLLELAERCSRPTRVSTALGLLGSRWTLEERIAGLLKPERNIMTRTRRRTVAITAVVLGVMSVVVGGVRGTDKLPSKSKEKDVAVEKSTKTRKVTIRGTCLDDSAKPIANAHVRIFIDTYEDPVTILTETKADADGVFELRDVEIESLENLVVTASAENHTSVMRRPPKNQAGVIELAMELSSNPGTLSGVVTDTQGRPVKGAVVFLGATYPYPGVFSAETDENGRYAITDLQRWSSDSDAKTQTTTSISRCYFRLRHPDYALTMASNTAVPQQVNVTLQPPAIVEGQVVDAVTNQPAANAVVSAQGVARSGWFRTRTDGSGRYRLVMTKDHYNIWAEADDRIAVAIKARKVDWGQKIVDADIRLVTGGFVMGRVLGADGQPLAPAQPPNYVAHYGPARPRTGAAVTSTPVRPDGTFRLRVAPGRNYIYLMNGGRTSAYVIVEDGRDVVIDLDLRKDDPDSFSATDPDQELASELRREAEDEDSQTQDATKRAIKPAARKRADTPTGKLLDRLEQQNAGNRRFEDAWCKTLKELVDLGPAAVPELIAELDATNNDMMLRCLGFTLRAINDKRAVPALIRAIPKTLLPPGSDMGCRAKDQVILKFMQQHDLDEIDEDHRYGFGRPVREIFGALQKLTGQKIDEVQLYSVFLEGLPSQRSMQRELFHRTASQWSVWWEQHWSEHLQDAAYSRVNLPALTKEIASLPKPDAHFKTGGGSSNWVLESIFDPKAKNVFFDLDTARVSSLPEKWRTSKNVDNQIDEIMAWAGKEGFDLFGAEYQSPRDGKRYYVLRPIGLRVWELGPDRWKMSAADITIESLQAEGTPRDLANGLLLHYDATNESFDPKDKATFFYITREGTPGVLFVGIEVKDDSLKAGGVSRGDDELRPIAFHKGRRLAWTRLEEVAPSKP